MANKHALHLIARHLGVPYSALLGATHEQRSARAAGLPNAPTQDYKPWYDVQRARVICGARTRSGLPCRAQGLGAGFRCKHHGGASTGPKTPEGQARALAALERGRHRKS